MKVLSIHDGHNASAAIFDDQKVLSCVSEERINRVKFYWGWPTESIKYVLNDAGLKLEDIHAVTVSHFNTLSYIKRKFSFKENYTLIPKIALGHLYHIYTVLKREIKVRKLFSGIKNKPKFYFCDHHLAHAGSAYYFSGFSDAIVLTIDAQGDGLSHSAYKVINNKWELIVRGGSNESLGAFYAAITEGLGFKANRHEGKIVGLAAMGDYNILLKNDNYKIVKILEDNLHFKRHGYYKMIEIVKEWLNQGYTKEDISAYGQYLLEDLVIKHVNKLCEITKLRNIGVAGGIFSNVKLNQKIAEQCPIDKIFVQPAMGDEGLVLGSASFYLNQFQNIKFKEKIKNVYFGNHYNNDYIENLLKQRQYKFEIPELLEQKIAQFIYDGKIIGWFDGKMEFGPRALGHRTMMADPRYKEINEVLNKRLRRSEFMPFAPSVLYESADLVFENVNPGIHPAEFMTITYNVKQEWRDKIKAVVHVDNTARPQLIKKEIDEAYYDVINQFYKISGIPLIVNTSFNIHEEPIVCSPEDALKSFEDGAVDYVVFNHKFLVYKKNE